MERPTTLQLHGTKAQWPFQALFTSDGGVTCRHSIDRGFAVVGWVDGRSAERDLTDALKPQNSQPEILMSRSIRTREVQLQPCCEGSCPIQENWVR